MEDVLRAVAYVLALPITPTISVALALWLVAGGFALRFNVRGWWRRRLILERALMLDRPPREQALAAQRHEAELIGVLIQAAFSGIGVLAATVEPSRSPPPTPPPWQSLLVLPVLIGVQVAMAFESWRQDRFDRIRWGAAEAPIHHAHTPEHGGEPYDAI